MIFPPFSRRNLLRTAINSAVAWLGSSLLTAQAGYSVPGQTELITLCSALGCSKSIGAACQLALSQRGIVPLSLLHSILNDIETPENVSREDLARALLRRSRSDFREDRVVSVDGWIFSLTETRLYALAGLLSEESTPIA
jgi:hypothetical protein